MLALFSSAVFSAAETALMSLNRAKLRTRLEEGERSARLIHAMIQTPRRLLSTILLGNTLATVTVVVFGTSLVMTWFHGAGLRAALVAIALLALTIVMFGEILPKSIAAARAEQVAFLIARPIRLAMLLLRPVNAGILFITTPLIRILGGHEALSSPQYTEDELKTLLEIGHEQGVIEEDESDLVFSALAFDDTPVAAILTPRVDIVALKAEATLAEVVEQVAQEGYSRMPVYRDSIDRIIGIIYVREALLAAAKQKSYDLMAHLQPAYFIPQNKRLNELLREMQALEIQMAIVNDEYGGTAGLVTVEDILEQIVGEIRDESDEELAPVSVISETAALVDSMASIEEVNETLDIDLPVDGYQTIGGLVLNRLGRGAQIGDVVELLGLRLTVKAIKGMRIQQVLIERVQSAEEPFEKQA